MSEAGEVRGRGGIQIGRSYMVWGFVAFLIEMGRELYFIQMYREIYVYKLDPSAI